MRTAGKLYAILDEFWDDVLLYSTLTEARRQIQQDEKGDSDHAVCTVGFCRITGVTPVPGVIYEVRIGVDVVE